MKFEKGDEAEIRLSTRRYDKGDIVTVTKVYPNSHFCYEIDNGKDMVSNSALNVAESMCDCGQKKIYSKSKSYVCPWCDI